MTEQPRKCIATGDVKPASGMIRFVIDPEGRLVPDLGGKLPGRGIWLTSSRAALEHARAKRLFARAARRPVAVDPDLADLLEGLLARRCLDLLGLARRAGGLVNGFEKVKAMLRDSQGAILIEASDAARHGRDKLRRLTHEPTVVEIFTIEEMSLALGHENVVHAALAPGRLAHRLLAECRRLGGFRSLVPDDRAQNVEYA